MTTAYCFDDVLLVPQMSHIESRKDIDTSSFLDPKFGFRIPIISSPMDTVTEEKMCIAMESMGGFGIIHRYNSVEDQAKLIKRARSHSTFVGAAVGVSGDFIHRAQAAVQEGASLVCVDIAHGHHVKMRYALEVLRNTFGTSVHIMAGNVATRKAFDDLSDWGADSIRVGIGGGSICSTRIQTGHGMPTLQSIIDCSASDRDSTLIADGGIRTSGDIVKALAAGADFVMLGSLLSATDESPGEVIYKDGRSFKTYRGMASVEAQIDWRGHASSVEGVSSLLPRKGPLSHILEGLETGIRSGLSYSGAANIIELQSKSEFVVQTYAGSTESSTHIEKLN